MKSSMTSHPESFESTLLCLFREWTFETKMMELIARREKDVIKNDFAKLGLFESRESKSICRKLNRFFTTKTFHENFPRLKTDQVTKFVIENSLMDLLPESFIDFRYLSLLLENLDVIYMREELVLIEKMINLLSPDVNLQEFLAVAETTTAYISRKQPELDKTAPIMKLVEIMNESASTFHNDPEINSFTRNLSIKLKSEEELPTIKEILENFHSINIEFIHDEFENQEIEISFNDPRVCAAYGEDKTLSYSNYVQQCQSTFGSYLFIRDVIKNFSTISRSQILLGAEEITKRLLEEYENRELVSHMISFLEMFSIDSRKLRCFLRLTKLKLAEDEKKSFASKLDETIKIDGDLRNVEAFEVFLKTKRIENPERSYLKAILDEGNWYRLVLLGQYLNFSLNSFVQICVEKLKQRALGDNLVRAVFFNSLLETKKQCKFSKKKRKTDKSEDHQMFQKGKFLDVKRDMFAVILKCDESVTHMKMTFEDFQKMMQKKEEKKTDLLFQAIVNDMPVLAVIAAMTNQYELIYCWIAWISLSSDFVWLEKFKSIIEAAKAVVQHCIEKGMVQTLDISLSIFYPESSMKILTSFLSLSLSGKFDEMEQILKQFIVKLTSDNYNLVVTSNKADSINFTMNCLMKHLQANHSIAEQEKFLDILCRSEIAQFSDKIDFLVFKRLCKILGRTNMQVNFEELSGHSKLELEKHVGRICGSLIDNHQFEAAIEIADLLNLPKSDFVFKFWLHMWEEDANNKNFDAEKYTKYVDKYDLRMEVLISFITKVLEELEPCIKKYNMMKFLLRNNTNESNSDLLEYEIVSLYVKLKCSDDSEKLKPLTSEYFESVIIKEKSIIFNSLYELKSIANVDELTISHKTLQNQVI